MKNWIIFGVIIGLSGLFIVLNGFYKCFYCEDKSVQTSVADPGESPEKAPFLAAAFNPWKVDKKEKPEKQQIKEESPDKPKSAYKRRLTPQMPVKKEIILEDRYKVLLIEHLENHGWAEHNINDLKTYIQSPQSKFLPREMKVNVTHVETKDQYRHNLKPKSINLCLNFWDERGDKVISGAKNRGVPYSIITSILKVETAFGTYMGESRVLDVYWSLALGDHPAIIAESLENDDPEYEKKLKKLKRRAKWGRKELENLMHIGRNSGLNLMEVKGSWAGAFGLCQFIPSSYRNFAVDGNADGIIDLDNLEDASASIANYLVENGWSNDLSKERKKKVIMRYNISEHYANCILDLSEILESKKASLRDS